MGGSVRKEMINSVTHVVANTVFGSKYKVLCVCVFVHAICMVLFVFLGCCFS